MQSFNPLCFLLFTQYGIGQAFWEMFLQNSTRQYCNNTVMLHICIYVSTIHDYRRKLYQEQLCSIALSHIFFLSRELFKSYQKKCEKERSTTYGGYRQQFSAVLTFFKILFKSGGRFVTMQPSHIPKLKVYSTYTFKGRQLCYIGINLRPNLNNILKKVSAAENY